MQRLGLPFLGTLATLVLVDQHLFSVRFAQGPSMTPTMPLASLVLLRRVYRPQDFQRGDIVACEKPVPDTRQGAIMKRIAAMEGDEVVLNSRDDGIDGTITIPKGH
ncbi:MAG: hypothetical protein SGCHY_005351, partial [Lobulomycetales sp.]